jgi:hypothetical protein
MTGAASRSRRLASSTSGSYGIVKASGSRLARAARPHDARISWRTSTTRLDPTSTAFSDSRSRGSRVGTGR